MKSFEEITKGIEEIVNNKNLSLCNKYHKLREDFLITEGDICKEENKSDCIEKETFEKLHKFIKENIYPKLIKDIKSIRDILCIRTLALPISRRDKWVFNDYEMVDTIYQILVDEGYLSDASLEDLLILIDTGEEDSGYSLETELPEIADEINYQINNKVIEYLDEMNLEAILDAFTNTCPCLVENLSEDTKEELKEKIDSLDEEEKEKWEEILDYLE